ncbi:unnamed protein product [Discula destructiva]
MAHEELLIDVVRRYDVPVDVSAVRTTFEHEEQGTLLSEWAKSYLTSDTLLTKGELNSYRSVERNGKIDTLTEATDLPSTLAFSDQEMQDAIDSLHRSTEAINKHTETLRQQQDALSRLLSTTGKNGNARSDLEATRLQKRASDRRTLDTAVELLSRSLDYRLTELEQQSKDAQDNMANTVDDMLHSDDKLLSSLQKLGGELDTEDPEETESVSKLRDICARLIKFNVECIRTKLDRIYLDSLEPFSTSGDNNRAVQEDVQAQQEELEELYSEILPVSQMSVEQQWLEPSLRSLSSKNGNKLNRSVEALRYILDCLDYLLDRTDHACERISTFKCHEAATATLVATTKHELSASIISRTQRGRPHSIIADTVATPAPSRTANYIRRRSSGSDLYDAPLAQLLDTLALSLPTSGSAQAQTAHLSRALADRTSKSAETARASQLTFERTATSHLTDARTALQLVRDSVLAESPFAEVRLVDPGIETSIGVLSQEVHNVRARLEGVEQEVASLARSRNVRKEELVARWGGRV